MSYTYYGIPIEVGDKFYHNNHCTKIGATEPDYLIITEVKEMWPYAFFTAKYENHYVDTIERTFSDVILRDSNLDPRVKKPEWIFLKGVHANA